MNVRNITGSIDWKVLYYQYIHTSSHTNVNLYNNSSVEYELISSYFIFKIYPTIYEELKEINFSHVGMYANRLKRDWHVWTNLFNLIICNKEYLSDCKFLKGSFDIKNHNIFWNKLRNIYYGGDRHGYGAGFTLSYIYNKYNWKEMLTSIDEIDILFSYFSKNLDMYNMLLKRSNLHLFTDELLVSYKTRQWELGYEFSEREMEIFFNDIISKRS